MPAARSAATACPSASLARFDTGTRFRPDSTYRSASFLRLNDISLPRSRVRTPCGSGCQSHGGAGREPEEAPAVPERRRALQPVNRRTFLRGSSLAVCLSLATACGALVPPSSPTVVGPAGPAAQATSASVKMPIYQPVTIASPDLPGDDKVEPGYFAFPKKVNKTITETPIKGGGEVNVMTWNVTGPIAPLEANTAWQAINQQVGAKINLVNNVSNSDYRTKLTAVVAGGELPDTMYIPATPGGQSAPFPQFPDFLGQSAADLTPYLSGDAVKEFPNLAAIPTRAWKSVTYHNKIFGVPVSFPLVPGTVLWEIG